MDTKLIVLVVVGCLYVAAVYGDKTSGKFQYKGRQCEWKELGAKNSHVRTLRVGCKGNKKKNQPQISCQYTGDPHPCQWYNKHQAAFYSCLVNRLAANPTCVCHAASVSCHNHCQDITFNKASEYRQYDQYDQYEQYEQYDKDQYDYEPYDDKIEYEPYY